MALLLAICIGFTTQLVLSRILFEDFDDFAYQLKSVLAWLPVTLVLDYDFSDSTWNFWIWLISGTVVGAIVFYFVSSYTL